MKTMQVKVKLITNKAKMPKYAHPTDAGADLYAVRKIRDYDNNIVTYGTGIAVEIPEGYVGLVFPRSSICKKTLFMTNSVGVIDSGYRGEILVTFRFDEFFANTNAYNIGDRIAQLIIIPIPKLKFVQSSELSVSDRGEGGYGSTGK